MYKNITKKEDREFKLRQDAITKYFYLNCFSFDLLLDKLEEGDDIYAHNYFLEKSRLYKKKEDKKYYSFTSLFLDIVKEQRKKGIDKIYIESIIDKIIEMKNNKIISTRMNFIKIKNEDYQDILINYIDKNDIQKYNIRSIEADELQDIISKDDYLLPCIIRHNGSKTYYKQMKKEEFINKYLEHNEV
tara:strand:+ start:1561 stop:2124 length:564 start_codon:yes stop_codon:yes gene_type:complete